ncbi:molybdopterin molybdotransferase MoeA [Cereibacter sp. SYSU M97828]|nr:molybdopterin molybdotransferase MoeA [Cereibacter flavus]
MIPVAEALARVLSLATTPGTETVALDRAAGRVMASPATARRDQPPFDAAAMDGYAAAEGTAFTVIGESRAGGAFAGRVGAGEAVRISTGAPVPVGATRVIMQEDVQREGDRITVTGTSSGTHIRRRGQDFAAGHSFAPRRLRPADLALLAAMDVPRIEVLRRPSVALISTGDELVMPGDPARDDQIISSNGFALKAMVEAEGGTARMLPIAPDDEASLRLMLDMARDADVIVTIGGASVGDHDLVGRVLADIGMDLAFHKIAMRPGKPLMAGRIGTSTLLGLPGNPISAIVCGHLFLLPLLRKMQGLEPMAAVRQARLAAPMAANGPRAHYMRASLQGDTITAFDRQDSALLVALAEADALLIRPAGDPAREAGEMVDYLPI